MKWRSKSRVLCDHRIPIKLKGKFYKTVIGPTMLHGTWCWVVEKQHIHKMIVTKTKMLTWISGNVRKVKIWNEEIHLKIGVAPIDENMRESRLRWFGHVRGEWLMHQWEIISFLKSSSFVKLNIQLSLSSGKTY